MERLSDGEREREVARGSCLACVVRWRNELTGGTGGVARVADQSGKDIFNDNYLITECK